jgi:hypothetical protein
MIFPTQKIAYHATIDKGNVNQLKNKLYFFLQLLSIYIFSKTFLLLTILIIIIPQ